MNERLSTPGALFTLSRADAYIRRTAETFRGAIDPESYDATLVLKAAEQRVHERFKAAA